LWLAMPPIQFVPWRQIHSWRCRGCGSCCKDYSVVLNFAEWMQITQMFGGQTTIAAADKFFIAKTPEGSCSFLCRKAGNYGCALQAMKPNACKIWPFKILAEPKYGQPQQAAFTFAGRQLYVYGDSNCSGLTYGAPSWEFTNLTLTEFAAISMGICGSQRNSTRQPNSYGSIHF
jgi:hypothetical protein